ncbi:MAG: PilZ domain-containing protein [Bryobacteraceae bacterium]|nr:PilZ domain-containing protein [Bryobacteraceae bacterium]
MKLPVELVRSGSERISIQGETMNVSSGGVLFTSEIQLEVGSPIEYLISLPSTGGQVGGVRLRCMGKVVRTDEAHHALAATLERYEFVRNSS